MGSNDLGTLDLGAYLAAYGRKVVAVKDDIRDHEGETWYCLEECVFDSNHRGNEAAIVQSPNQPFLAYACFHNSCRNDPGRTWKAAREKISGKDSLAKFCANYDPEWRAPARGSAQPVSEESVVDSIVVLPASRFEVAMPAIPPPDEMEYADFCIMGSKGYKFVPMRLARYLVGYFQNIVHTSEIFWFYEKGVWRELGPHTIRNAAIRALGEDAQPRRVSEAISLVSGLVNREEDEWVKPGILINCLNGMVDPVKLDVLDHDPSYDSRSQVPVRFDPDAVDEVGKPWFKFLNEIYPEPDGVGEQKRKILHQFLGYCYLLDCRYEASLWLYGTGANGKSTLTKVMQEVVGRSNSTSLRIADLKDPRFNLYYLQNKMLNVSSEMSERDPLSTEVFKAFVSGDSVTTERKYGSKYDFVPYVKFVICLNDLPVIPDKSYGFERRLLVLRHNQRFEGADMDPDLFDKLVEAKDGIFTWAVLGLNSLLSQNGFNVGEKVREDNAEFVKSLNPALEFIDEELEFDPGYRVGSTALYMRYTEWCKKFRHRPLGRMKFNDQLSKNYPEVEKRQSGSDRRISFFGVRFKEGILGG